MKEKFLDAIKKLFPKPENCLNLEMNPNLVEFDSIRYGIVTSGNEYITVFLYIKDDYDRNNIGRTFVEAFEQTFPMVIILDGTFKPVKTNNVYKLIFDISFRLKTKEDIAIEKQKKEREARQKEVDIVGDIVFRRLREKGKRNN